MNKLITEKANRDAFLPIASMRNTALRDPNKAPIHRRLPAILLEDYICNVNILTIYLLIHVAWSLVMLMASCSMMEGMAEEV